MAYLESVAITPSIISEDAFEVVEFSDSDTDSWHVVDDPFDSENDDVITSDEEDEVITSDEEDDVIASDEEYDIDEEEGVTQLWIQTSSLAAEHVAAGSFDTAMQLLNTQLGIRNFAPLRSLFVDLHLGSFSYLPELSTPIERELTTDSPSRRPPALIFKFSQLDVKLRKGYKATTAGTFAEALGIFKNILHTIPLIVVESRREVDEVKEMISIVKEYVLGLQMELRRRELNNDPIRQQELAAYFTHCNLQLPHMRLTLLNAMRLSYRARNFRTAANFATRLLKTNPSNENQVMKARQVLQKAERRNNLTDTSELNYDFRNPFVICGATYVPIYHGQNKVLCPFCSCNFLPSQEGKLCSVCELSVVGVNASGLLCSPSQATKMTFH